MFLLWSYLIGTTEKIFESKSQLYDIYVDNQNVITSAQALKDLLKITDADREKLTKLNNQRYLLFFTTLSAVFVYVTVTLLLLLRC